MEHVHVYQVELFATENASIQPSIPQIAVHAAKAAPQGCTAITGNAHVREGKCCVMGPASTQISMIRIVDHAGIVVLQAQPASMELAKKFREDIEDLVTILVKSEDQNTQV